MPHNHNLNTMTVGELKEYLEDFPEDMKVVFAYNYGDHWHTTVHGTINNVETCETEWSDYHEKFVEASGDGDDDEEAGSDVVGDNVVLVLR